MTPKILAVRIFDSVLLRNPYIRFCVVHTIGAYCKSKISKRSPIPFHIFHKLMPISTILRFQIDHLFEVRVYNFYLMNEDFDLIDWHCFCFAGPIGVDDDNANEIVWSPHSCSNLVHNFILYRHFVFYFYYFFNFYFIPFDDKGNEEIMPFNNILSRVD